MSAPRSAVVPLSGSQPVPSVTAHVWADDASGPVVILAHGAGSRLDHPVHQGVCSAIAEHGHPVASFNFPYTEAGRRSPDPAARLRRCWQDVVAWAHREFPDRPLVLGGRSMGGRYASLVAAEGTPCAGLVLLNYPLMPSHRKPDSRPRTDHWPAIDVSVIFVHGDRDRLFPVEVFAAERQRFSVDVTVHAVQGADHGFAVPKRRGRTREQVLAEVGDAVSRWLAAAVAPA